MMPPMAAQLVPPASAEETPDPDIDLLFESRSIINNTKHPRFKMMYRLYVPEGYKEKKYPIVLHLNGNGQDGSDNVKHLKSAKNFPTLLMKGDNPKSIPASFWRRNVRPENNGWIIFTEIFPVPWTLPWT